jgi:hypothetical protein
MYEVDSSAGLRPKVFITTDERRRWVTETVERPVPFYSNSNGSRHGTITGIVAVSAKDVEDAVVRGGEAGGQRLVPGQQGFAPAALVDVSGRGLYALIYRAGDQYGIDPYKIENGNPLLLPDARHVSTSEGIAGYINNLIKSEPPDFKHEPSSPPDIPGRPKKVEANFYSLPEGYTPQTSAPGPVVKRSTPA